jgi:nucleoside diphosphate kinase
MSNIIVLIKPPVLAYANEILSHLSEKGELLYKVEVNNIASEDIKNHYKIHEGKTFFNDLLGYFIGKNMILALYNGNIDKFNSLKSIIRNEYDCHIPNNPNGNQNSIHISDSKDEANREYDVWEKHLKRPEGIKLINVLANYISNSKSDLRNHD